VPAPETGILEVIAQASGGPRLQPSDVERAAVEAASARVAWVQIDHPTSVARLLVAAGGRVLVDRKLNLKDETNWGYEGCNVPYLQWWGDRVVAISVEENVKAVWSVSTRGEIEVRRIGDAWDVERDLVCWLSQDYPGLLATLELPSLRALVPLPWRHTTRRARVKCENGEVVLTPSGDEGTGTESVRLPAAVQRSSPGQGDAFFARVARALSPDAGADESLALLVEAAARPFARDELEDDRPPVPLWMPVYWYRHLVAAARPRDAEQHLARLDAIAAPLGEHEPERGWSPTWSSDEGALALAVRYVRRQARVQARVCRTGELPRGWWCLLFMPAPRRREPGSRVDPSTLTPALRRAFDALVPTAPPEIPHQW